MNKKAIAILGAIFLLIVGTLGFLIYSKYSTKTPSTATSAQPNNNQNASTTPPIGIASTTPVQAPVGAVLLTSDQVVSPALFYNGSGITYFDTQGDLFQANIQDDNGQLSLTGKKQLTIPPKTGITKILWPAKGNDFIAQLPGPNGNPVWSYFNSSTGAYTALPPQIESIDWMPSGDKIMYVWVDNNAASLNSSNPDTSNYQKVADLWETNDQLSVSPDGSQVLFYLSDTATTTSIIKSVTSDGQTWKGLVTNGSNFGVLWSPDSQKFLFGKKDINSQNYDLWVYNIATGEVKSLGVATTPDKAVWSPDSSTVYASVPSSQSQGPNSLTQDVFNKIDITTLEKKQYNSGSSPIDGTDLFLNSTGDKLFFRNAQDGGLYYLDLSQQ